MAGARGCCIVNTAKYRRCGVSLVNPLRGRNRKLSGQSAMAFLADCPSHGRCTECIQQVLRNALGLPAAVNMREFAWSEISDTKGRKEGLRRFVIFLSAFNCT